MKPRYYELRHGPNDNNPSRIDAADARPEHVAELFSSAQGQDLVEALWGHGTVYLQTGFAIVGGRDSIRATCLRHVGRTFVAAGQQNLRVTVSRTKSRKAKIAGPLNAVVGPVVTRSRQMMDDRQPHQGYQDFTRHSLGTDLLRTARYVAGDLKEAHLLGRMEDAVTGKRYTVVFVVCVGDPAGGNVFPHLTPAQIAATLTDA